MRSLEFFRRSLFEVVLHTPIEQALAPLLAKAPNDQVKKWLTTNFKNWLVKTPENLVKLDSLPAGATEKQKKAFEFGDLYDVRLSPQLVQQYEHWLDFFRDNPRYRLDRATPLDVQKAADEWMKRLHARAKKTKDDPSQVEEVMEFPNGWRIVSLIGREALNKEGSLMGHCVGSHCDFVFSGARVVFSLRDPNDQPHATMEIEKNNRNTTEIKGKRNRAPVRKYWPMLLQFLESNAINVENDYINVGYLRVNDPKTGEYKQMSQDEFRQMVLDPQNEQGQEYTRKYVSHAAPSRLGNHDTMLGMFVSLYGTDKLPDSLIQGMFDDMPDHAIQVVQHYGNKFNTAQLAVAFASLGVPYGDYEEAINDYKELLAATKPDQNALQQIISALNTRGAVFLDRFMGALIAARPEQYGELLRSDPKMIEKELAMRSKRAAGPLLAFLDHGDFGSITSEMVEAAFRYMPLGAMNRIQRTGMKVDEMVFDAAMLGMGGGYHRDEGDEERRAVMARLVEGFPPTSEKIQKTLEEMSKGCASDLLTVVRQVLPDALDQETVEYALMVIDYPSRFDAYLKEQPQPLRKMQEFFLNRDIKENEGYLKKVQKIDPAIFALAVETLRPSAVAPTKRNVKHFQDKKKQSRHVEYQVPKTDSEILNDQRAARTQATKRFINVLDSLVSEPDSPDDAPLDPHSPKFIAAREQFERLGKSGLFGAGIARLDRGAMRARIAGDGSNHYMKKNYTPPDIDLFRQSVGKMHASDIADLMQTLNYSTGPDLFVELINHAPQRLPSVCLAMQQQGNSASRVYGKLDQKGIDKDKLFEALEAIWGSRLSDEVIDEFTQLVFKRFKPSKERLLDLLKAADSSEATKYVLKKTKKPTQDLLDFVLSDYPKLLGLVSLAAMSDAFLAKVVKQQPKIAVSLMNRDLRDYGSDSRSKWETPDFRKRIDPDSAEYARYEGAFEAAGAADTFAKYVRMEKLDNDPPYDGRDIDFAKLEEHLSDYSDRVLVNTAKRDDKVIQFLFERLSPRRLARLVVGGMFGSAYNYYHMATEIFGKLPVEKVQATIDAGLEAGNPMHGFILGAIKEGVPIDSDLTIKILSKKTESSDFLPRLIGREDISDEVKNWVADNKPHLIEHIRYPNAYVVKKLFDNYAKISRGYGNDHEVNIFFRHAVEHWFRGSARFSNFVYRPNPELLKMLKDEALRRGGVAVIALRAMLHHIKEMRDDPDAYSHSIHGPDIAIVPRGYKAEED